MAAAPPPAAARFWPTPSPRGRGRLGRSLALLLCIAYLSLARPRGEGGAQERARARGRAGAVCCLGADSAGGAGGVQKRRAGRDLGALRERLQAEDEQRDRGASERRRGRAARPRIVAGIWAAPRGIYPQGWLLPGGRVAASHLRLLRQQRPSTLHPLRELFDPVTGRAADAAENACAVWGAGDEGTADAQQLLGRFPRSRRSSNSPLGPRHRA